MFITVVSQSLGFPGQPGPEILGQLGHFLATGVGDRGRRLIAGQVSGGHRGREGRRQHRGRYPVAAGDGGERSLAADSLSKRDLADASAGASTESGVFYGAAGRVPG